MERSFGSKFDFNFKRKPKKQFKFNFQSNHGNGYGQGPGPGHGLGYGAPFEGSNRIPIGTPSTGGGGGFGLQSNSRQDYFMLKIAIRVDISKYWSVIPIYLKEKLKRMKLLYGEYPKNEAFLSFLEDAVDKRKLLLVKYILDHYVGGSLFDPQPNGSMLSTLTFSVLHEKESEDKEEVLVDIVKKVILKTDFTQLETNWKRDFLEWLVTHFYPDYSWYSFPFRGFYRETFRWLLKRPLGHDLDLRPHLDLALTYGKNEAAKLLLQKFVPVIGLDVNKFNFGSGALEVYKSLYYAGYKYPEVGQLVRERSFFVFPGYEDHFDAFCEWLRLEQGKVLPLKCLTWFVIRNSFGSKVCERLVTDFVEDEAHREAERKEKAQKEKDEEGEIEENAQEEDWDEDEEEEEEIIPDTQQWINFITMESFEIFDEKKQERPRIEIVRKRKEEEEDVKDKREGEEMDTFSDFEVLSEISSNEICEDREAFGGN